MARTAQIVSTARYLPERAITNAELAARFTALGYPGVIEKFAHGTGIGQRFYVPDDWATSDLALPAATEALKRAGRKPADLDLIIVATGSPDYITPDTSAVLQHKLGARNAGALDVRCACASFTTSLAVASGLIASNPSINTILVAAAEMLHKLADADDPTSFLWGDGAGAVVLESGESNGFVGAAFQADGAYASYWGIFAGGTAEPASVDAVKAGRTKVRRLRNYPADEELWARLFKRLANENDFTADEVDHLLIHTDQQARDRNRGRALQCTDGKMPYHHGEIRLHRRCLYPDGIGRCHRTWQDQTRRPRRNGRFWGRIQPSRSSGSYDYLIPIE